MARWPLLSVLAAVLCVVIAAGVVLLVPGSDDDSSALAASTPTLTVTPSPPPQATATPLPTLYLDIRLPGPHRVRVEQEAAALAREIGVTMSDSASAGGATVLVSAATSAGAGASAVVERWLPVASIWSLRDTLALDAPDAGRLLLPAQWRADLAPMLAGTAVLSSAVWLPEAEVRAILESELSAVALLPLSALSGDAPLRLLGAGVNGAPWLEQRIAVTWQDGYWHDFGTALAERLDVAAPVLTTIAVTGDIMVGRCVYERHRNLDDYTAAFVHVEAYLRGVDVLAGSLDGAMSDAGTPIACEETFNLLGPARSIEGFVAAGFDVVSLATNHAKDCGSTGFVCGHQSLRDSIALLRGAGIAPAGAGENLVEAHLPVVVEANGVRIAFLAYDDVSWAFYGATETAPGTAPLSEEALRAGIAAARDVADVVIVLPHWGIEYTPFPTARQRHLAGVAIEAGATLVAGNHPHAVQATEAGPGWFVAYALGNFVFDQDWSLETQQGAVLEATFSGTRLIGVTLKPVRIVNMFQPTFAGGDEARWILDRMRSASE